MAHTHAMTHTETCTRAHLPLVPARCPGQSSRASLQLSWTFRTTLLYTSFQPGITCGQRGHTSLRSLRSLLTKWLLTLAVDMSAASKTWCEGKISSSAVAWANTAETFTNVSVCVYAGRGYWSEENAKETPCFFSSQLCLAQCTTQTWKEWRSTWSNQTWIHV